MDDPHSEDLTSDRSTHVLIVVGRLELCISTHSNPKACQLRPIQHLRLIDRSKSQERKRRREGTNLMKLDLAVNKQNGETFVKSPAASAKARMTTGVRMEEVGSVMRSRETWTGISLKTIAR
jgi:hypothetical protein